MIPGFLGYKVNIIFLTKKLSNWWYKSGPVLPGKKLASIPFGQYLEGTFFLKMIAKLLSLFVIKIVVPSFSYFIIILVFPWKFSVRNR